MLERELHRARIVSSVAATAISLACGTNYVYSAWAPQFADKLHFSTTQSNLIGVAGNLGMYTLGVPIGMAIDSRGPRPAVILGALLLGAGYLPLKLAYDAGSGSVPLLCVFSYMTGLGGCMAFASAVKTSALNWPHHRGTATAFPLAAFGLSAFFFSVFGEVFFPGDTGAFLLILAAGTFGLPFVSFFFLRVLPHAHAPHVHGAHRHSNDHHHPRLPYQAVSAGGGGLTDSQELRRTQSAEAKASGGGRQRSSDAIFLEEEEPGTSPHGGGGSGGEEGEDDGRGGDDDSRHPTPPAVANPTGPEDRRTAPEAARPSETALGGAGGDTRSGQEEVDDYSARDEGDDHHPQQQRRGEGDPDRDVEAAAAAAAFTEEADERSSLMSRSSTSSSLPGELFIQSSVDLDRSHRVDIRGWALMRNIDFWQMFSIMGILAGIGLMTINNIGHDANALWKSFDPTVNEEFLISRQQMHVSILSVGSFTGRLSSGVGSDFLVKVLHASRVWCLVFASLIFCLAQVSALTITNPHLLGLVSGLSGLGYGFLFGVFPSIVAESFGIHGLSQNWGFMTLSPVISGYIFNLFYGRAFDSHSVVGPDGERTCPDGLECYRSAYFVTLGACGLGLVVTLAVIRHQRLAQLRVQARMSGGPD